ncbi:MAG TPA: LuxR C-terminal-related transcriptional regulator [Pirellulaceae bacterium]|nr:LuxR C-terminal-related transcriptional regulator [Pirellulaceae bacterium]
MGSKRDYQKATLPVVRARARVVFQGHADVRDKVNDAISVGWELSLTAPPGTPPKSIAYYACLQVKIGRQFRQSERSIDGPNPRRRKKPQREVADVGKVLARPGNNPAAIATVLMDYTAWLPSLTDREQELLEAFLRGDSTKELARRYRISPARVSQIRRELVEYWQAFTSE